MVNLKATTNSNANTYENTNINSCLPSPAHFFLSCFLAVKLYFIPNLGLRQSGSEIRDDSGCNAKDSFRRCPAFLSTNQGETQD
jgi:hypothetical protein